MDELTTPLDTAGGRSGDPCAIDGQDPFRGPAARAAIAIRSFPGRVASAHRASRARARAVDCGHLKWVSRSAGALSFTFLIVSCTGVVMVARQLGLDDSSWVFSLLPALLIFLGPDKRSFQSFRTLEDAPGVLTCRATAVTAITVMFLAIRLSPIGVPVAEESWWQPVMIVWVVPLFVASWVAFAWIIHRRALDQLKMEIVQWSP